jgi:hypothetical protein
MNEMSSISNRRNDPHVPRVSEVLVRLILVDPPRGVDFGIQRGRGSGSEAFSVQRSDGGDLSFEFSLTLAGTAKNRRPNFGGPFVQGPPARRFIYVNVGTYAGQKDTPWSRRMKVPLQGITWQLIESLVRRPGYRLTARIPGTGKDGGPNCASVELLGEWQVRKEAAQGP